MERGGIDLEIEKRKDDHIGICLDNDVRVSCNHWDDVYLHHQAIPRANMEEIDLSVELLGKKLDAPLMVAGMIGGSGRAKEYNRVLARAAEQYGIGFGIGSQRAGLTNPEFLESYSVVKEFEIPLVLGNIGAPQIIGSGSGGIGEDIKLEEVMDGVIEMIGADAVAVHLNYLQEAVQPEGDRFVRGFEEALRRAAAVYPIVLKETGGGISREVALFAKDAGVKAIDVGGMSGTTFAGVESYRDPTCDGLRSMLGRTYWNWGIPTPVSVLLADVGIPVIATGGIRNGRDVVRSLVLGATTAGMAYPLLKAAERGYDELERTIGSIIEEIRVGLFLSGASSVDESRNIRYVLTGMSGDLISRFAPGSV